MGAWQKTMEPQKENSPGPGSEAVERQRLAKEQAAQRVYSWTLQNEMRGVLRRMSAGAAKRILDFAYSKKIGSLTVSCVSCSEDKRAHSKCDEGAQVPR